MTQCRMCSQRLTRPGKLCRECERELDRSRQAGVSIGEVPPPLMPLDTPQRAGTRWIAHLRAPGPVVAAAFAIGLVGAVSLHAIQSSTAGMTSASVMLDRDLRNLKPRTFAHAAPLEAVAGVAPATTARQATPPAAPDECAGADDRWPACAEPVRDYTR